MKGPNSHNRMRTGNILMPCQLAAGALNTIVCRKAASGRFSVFEQEDNTWSTN